MPKIVNLKQGSEEWKEWRKGGITASMTAAILGMSPFQTRLQLWEEIVLGIEKPITPSMERGSRLEAQVREKINRKYASKGLFYEPTCMEHDIIPWLRCSLDGYCHESKKAIEIKLPGVDAHQMAVEGKIPAYNIPQLQKQMLVADLQELTYVSDDGSEDDPIEIVVKRDDDFIKSKILPQEAEFYSSILKFKPPEPSDRDVVKIVDPVALNAATSYSNLIQQIETLQLEADQLKQLLISCAHHDRALIGNLRLSRMIRKGAIDYEKIPELNGVDLDKYRKSHIQNWRIVRGRDANE